MSVWLSASDDDGNDYRKLMASHGRDHATQLVLAVGLGASAFLAFCVLRPKWADLYAARKRKKNAAARLPELPKSMFGWIPALYKISEEEVLASAGLDAYAFLTFFRYAIKVLTTILFFSLIVILPVNAKYTKGWNPFMSDPTDNSTLGDDTVFRGARLDESSKPPGNKKKLGTQGYLWMYVFFVYFFTVLALYFLVVETKKVIRVRQSYLGTQATVTDRTLRLSGIPPDMRSEEKIKEFIEGLGIGKVDSIMLCRRWKYLDELMEKRMSYLRRLEQAWTVYHGHHRARRNVSGLPLAHPPPPPLSRIAAADEEHTQLLSAEEIQQANAEADHDNRPTTRIWYGPLKMYSNKVDAIDYYEEKLRQYDEKILSARKKEYTPTPLAFVTMESVVACQMAVQAILDPRPGQLLASLAPPPADVIWENTYLSRSHRMFRSWTIMIFIGLLTIFWAALLVPFAGLMNPSTLGKVFPGFEDFLNDHKVIQSLITTSLPTAAISLMTIIVPYLYAYLSSLQGMTSQGDVELSVISKNFFFTFFSLFIVFTSLGTFANFYGLFENLREIFKDTTTVALALAKAVNELGPFYTNLIILQGFGLFPFRLLEFGAVALYPFNRMFAKTPRDFAEIHQPPVFSYGFFLPQTMLIFIICLVYSILPTSWLIVLCGVIYFCIGGFIYKYQLLYAMDHRQHSTGRAWPMICNRVITGLVVFQLVMIGYLVLQTAVTGAGFVVPALIGTLWFSVYFVRTYEPLTKYIALRSIVRPDSINLPTPTESRWDSDTNYGREIDTDPETGLRYIYPRLYEPLEKVWIVRDVSNGAGH